MFNSKHHILKAVLGSAMAGLLLFGISSKASAAKVDKNYAVKTTTSLTERAKVVSVKDPTKMTTAIWNYPYLSNKNAKKTHWLKNYTDKSLLVTKQATLKNGMKYDYIKVASKPSVKGWVYDKWIRQMTMASLGDSITKGWTGSDYAADPYPEVAASKTGMSVTNYGENNGEVSGDTDLDLTYNIENHSFKNTDVITIAYGVNDYFHVLSLAKIKNTLDTDLTELQAKYPDAQIVGILPMDCWVLDSTTDTYVNAADTLYKDHAYSLSDVRDTEKEVYEAHNVKVFNWSDYESEFLPNADSRLTFFGDNRLHPTASSYKKMGSVLATYLESNLK